MNEISLEKAKEILSGFTSQAEELLKNPAKVEELLQQLENKMKEIPTVGEYVSRLPLMISMIRAYIRKEYTAVSPKVIVTMVAAVIYLLLGKDLIPDKTPIVGYADDLAVFVAAFALVDPELNAYAQWRGEQVEPEAAPEA